MITFFIVATTVIVVAGFMLALAYSIIAGFITGLLGGLHKEDK